MMWALVWKEYREHRAAWLVLAVLSVVAMAGLREAMKLFDSAPASFDHLVAVGGIALCIYATVSGALTFANEREAGTLPFLDSVSRRRAPIWVAKVLVGVILNVCLLLCLLVFALVLDSRGMAFNPWSLFIRLCAAIIYLFPVLFCFAWALVGSALARSPFTAIGWALVITPAVAIVFGLLSGFTVLWGCVVLAVVGAGVSGLIFCRPDWNRWSSGSGMRFYLPRALAPRSLKALTWLVFRQGRARITALVIGAGVLGLFLPGTDFLLLPLVTLVIGIFCGTAVVADEQRGGTARLLADQRMPLGFMWLTKTILWCLLAAVVIGVLLLVGIGYAGAWVLQGLASGPHERLQMAWAPPIGIWTVLLLSPVYGFTIGQLMGIVARKEVIAIVVTLFLCICLIAVWMPSLVLGIDRWQLYVVPVILLIAAWLTMWPWASGRLNSLRPVLGLLACALLCCAWIAGCLWYRVAGVPDVGEPFDVKSFLAEAPTAEENQAGRLMHLALREYSEQAGKVTTALGPPKSRLFPADPAWPQNSLDYDTLLAEVLRKGWPEKAPELDRWLDQMMKLDWAKHIQQAAASPVGMLVDMNAAPLANRNDMGSNAYALPSTLAGHALQLQARGKDREALGELMAILTLSKTVRNHAGAHLFRLGANFQITALMGLEQWRKKAKPELVRQAFDQLTRYERDVPSVASNIKAQYVLALNAMVDAPTALGIFAMSDTLPHERLANQMLVLAWRTPWEQQREIRLLKLVCAGHLKALDTPLWELRKMSGRMMQPETYKLVTATSWVPPSAQQAKSLDVNTLDTMLGHSPFQFYLVWSPPLRSWDDRIRQQAEMTRIRLALDLYKAEKGRAPDSLDELVPKYFSEVPVNPLIGAPFTLKDALASDDQEK